MKKLTVLLLLLTGCVTQEEEERICIDYKIISYETEKCTPLYGQLICHDVVKKTAICTLYHEEN